MTQFVKIFENEEQRKKEVEEESKVDASVESDAKITATAFFSIGAIVKNVDLKNLFIDALDLYSHISSA